MDLTGASPGTGAQAAPRHADDPLPTVTTVPGRSLLARASALPALTGEGAARVGERALAAGVRGALTSWVQLGLLVRRARGERALRETDSARAFALVAGLAEAAVEGRPVPLDISPEARRTTHVRLLATTLPAAEAMAAVQRAVKPYTTASSASTDPPVAVGYFALRELLARRARSFSLQVVHLSTPSGVNQLSLQLPREAPLPSVPADDAEAGSLPPREWLARVAAAAGLHAVPALSQEDLLGSFGLVGAAGLQRAGLDGRPLAATHLAATAPATLTGAQALRLVDLALRRLGDHRTPPRVVSPALPENGVLVQLWEVTLHGHRLPLTAASRIGGRRRPTQVVLTLHAPASTDAEAGPGTDGPTGAGPDAWAHAGSGPGRTPGDVTTSAVPAARAPGDGPGPDVATQPETDPDIAAEIAALLGETPPAAAAADEKLPAGSRAAVAEGDASELVLARELVERPIWWRSVGGRLDGDDVVLYEAVAAGRRLRVRANDYPREPMYTLLVGPGGAVTASVDLEYWPPAWARPIAG